MLDRLITRYLILLVLALAVAGQAAAEAPASKPPLVLPSDAELAARLGFLEERLDAARPTALAWEYGWTGFYAVGFATNVVWAVKAGDGDDRVRGIVDATKSALATAEMVNLLRDPLPASHGAQPMRDVPGDGRAARLERLAVGERLLRESVARADTRYSWRRHLLGIATNLLGGAAIWTLGDGRDAAESTLIGIAVGEVQIWSQPWRAAGDLRDYEAQFPDAGQTAWSVRARGPGVELAWRF